MLACEQVPEDPASSAPKVILSYSIDNPYSLNTWQIKVKFNQNVTGLILFDFKVLGADKELLTGTDNKYLLTITNASEGEVIVYLPEGAALNQNNIRSEISNELITVYSIPTPTPEASLYNPLGVGGGGAMSGTSISPYTNTWFVGTDMGTLFRSKDSGKTWFPVNHYEAVFDSHLPYAVSIGFLADGKTVFHAPAGINPSRSTDEGSTFSKIQMGLNSNERIIYWHEDSKNENSIYAATTNGFLKSNDKGINWSRTNFPAGLASGSYIDHNNGITTLFYSSGNKIYKSSNSGESYEVYYSSNTNIRSFTGGRDSIGVTLVFSDSNGLDACVWALAYRNSWGQSKVDATTDTCGYVWIKKNSQTFQQTNQTVGDHLKMAENDSQTIYTTGGKYWLKQYGTKVHLSENAGSTWSLKLFQLNWDMNPFMAWPESNIEYSAVALDVGWWDDGYESFSINRLNSSIVAGCGYFFLFSSKDKGNYWDAPFTEFKDVVYAATADIGGMISDDGGDTFRISKALYNSNYDDAFAPTNDQIVFAASGNDHDYPEGWHANSMVSNGGIFKSNNRGHDWTRLTPFNTEWNRQFLSVAFDEKINIVYGGSQGDGVARSTDGGKNWSWFNLGFPSGKKIIPQMIKDPLNSNLYALLTGNKPEFTNQAATGIYFLDVENNSTSWKLLRSTVVYPSEADPGFKAWWYPTAFAVDFTDSQRNTFWLVDYENNRNWLMTEAWKTTDRGETWNRKLQFTHSVAVKLDPINANNVFLSGGHDLDGSWGNGGQVFSNDGGNIWEKNLTPNLQQNGRNSLVDPNNAENIFYTYFGGGILKGPNPTNTSVNLKTEMVTSK